MIINICGDFAPIGASQLAIEKCFAFSPDVMHLFGSSDLNIVNLEAPIAPDKPKAIKKVGPNLYTSSLTISYLKRSNVRLVTLANNHFNDFGPSGVEKTIKELRENGVAYVGGGIDSEEVPRIFYFEKDQIRVAVLNYCESEFSVSGRTGGEGSNPMNPVRVYRDLQIAKVSSDYRVVICHGGHEGYQLPSPRMKELYHFFIDAGADFVCNHHQHCFSGWEEYKNGKIFYGLGNFFFEDHRPLRRRSPIWNYGYIVSIELNTGASRIKLLPYKQCVGDGQTINLLNGSEVDEFNKKIYQLSSIIADDSALSSEFSMWCCKQRQDILSRFSPYSNRILLSLCRRKLLPKFITIRKQLMLYNTIRCESHRDVAMEVLKLD